MIVNNLDAPGVGFNDPTPATPVGGNAGTTVGQQRLIAYKKALELWGKTLASDATIVVQGSFARLSCTASGGTLAQAGAIQIWADFPNAPLTNHWYGSALANAISGFDLSPGPLDPVSAFDPSSPGNDDIIANFNGDVGKPDCIAGPGWYYGLDSNPGPGQIDFLDTFMHEVSHGLGFQNFANEANGSTPLGLPDVYMANTLDLDLKGLWDTFTPAQIRFSAVNNGRVVWAGKSVSENAGLVLGPYEGISVTTGGITSEVEYGAAGFGPAPSAASFNGQVVLASDGVAAPGGGTATDACEPITASVAGKIALVDRGLCTFTVKAKNAQLAGATGVIIANTLGRPSFEPGGTDSTVTVPTIGISNAAGDSIKAALPVSAVTAKYFIDSSRLAGVAEGYVRLYAPRTVALGSSISHFDVTAAPSLLMEPFITPGLRANENLDLTPSLMADIGWKLETLKVDSCDTGVANALPNGALLNVQVEACAAGAKNKGQFVSCVNGVTNAAKKAGLLTGQQHGKITSCTAKAK
jgi:hypothetical protein